MNIGGIIIEQEFIIHIYAHYVIANFKGNCVLLKKYNTNLRCSKNTLHLQFSFSKKSIIFCSWSEKCLRMTLRLMFRAKTSDFGREMRQMDLLKAAGRLSRHVIYIL